MILIANRGNLYGPLPETENSTDTLNDAIARGFHVTIDLWWYDDCFWLGTRSPKYKLMGGGEDWLQYSMNSLWIHARDPEALRRASDLGLNVFWHQTDEYALTTWGYMLGFYGRPPVGDQFVHMMPEVATLPLETTFTEHVLDACEHSYAVRSDYVGKIDDDLVSILSSVPSLDYNLHK